MLEIKDPYISLVEELLDASHTNSWVCANTIVEKIFKYLDIQACSFYSYYSDTEILSLRAQKGFNYDEYSSFDLPINSIAGDAITKSKIQDSSELTVDNGYRDNQLVEKYSLTRMVAVPLGGGQCISTQPIEICQEYIGVLCIYPNEEFSQFETLEKLSSLIGKVYAFSVDYDKVEFRKKVVDTSLQAKDLNSFLHKLVSLLQSEYGIEAASVFIHDNRNDQLYMRATTGIQNSQKLRLIERIYNLEERQYDTVNCFINSAGVITKVDNAARDHKYPELISDDFKSIIYTPIYEPGVEHEGEESNSTVVGVLRTVNRRVKRGNVTEICHHGWEDISLSIFAAEVIGVIGHLFQRADEISLNFVRAMHGAHKPLRASKLKTKAIQHLLSHSEKGTMDDFLKLGFNPEHFLKSAVSYLDALSWQFQKHEARDAFKRPKVKKIELYGDVLAPQIGFVKEIYPTYNVAKQLINSFVDYLDIPPVLGDEKALSVVFRNIFENAMKYTDHTKHCEIELAWKLEPDVLVVSISDFGIGVSEKDAGKIFKEGFRAIPAMGIDPTGTGIGLSDSRDIMRKMQGDIIISNLKKPTTFEVHMQLTRGYRN